MFDDDGPADLQLDLTGRSPRRPREWLFRSLFGALGTALGLLGLWQVLGPDSPIPVVAWRIPAAMLMGGVAAFSLFNVLLWRRWRWPGRLCLISLPLLFIVRLAVPPG